MKKILVALVILFWAGQLQAGVITVNADDEFTGFTINGVSFLNAIPNTENWLEPGSFNYDFLPGTDYTLTWNLRNVSNTMGFIGQVDLGDGQVYNSRLHDPNWSFATTALIGLSETKADDTSLLNPWRKANTGAISDAYWVGTKTWVGSRRTLTATLRFTTPAAPVPVPAAVWMLGSGLVALVGIRRKTATA